MATDRLRRLLRMSLFLQCRRPMACGDLADVLGVSKRTIFRDIRLLQAAGLDVAFDPTDGAYVLRSRLLKPVDAAAASGAPSRLSAYRNSDG